MTAIRQDITIEQGATYRAWLNCVDRSGDPIDLSGGTLRMQVRTRPEDHLVLASVSSDGAGIETRDAAAGQAVITIAASVTAGMPAGVCVYDLELEQGATVTRLMQGRVTVLLGVTR